MSIIREKLPKFGFGLMRLPKIADKIDIPQVCKMVDAYMGKGFNYFDTAYVYGESEKSIYEALVKRYPRESFLLATKLPPWLIKNESDRDRIFNEQLERTGAGYFDFYLLHSLEDGSNYDTCEKYDCFAWAMRKKQEGKIKHFGFSYHGSPELLERILDKHSEVEFVQIQLNYADWDNPLVRSGKLYDILKNRNIPIIIMEPVKGGTLADMAPELASMMKNARPNNSLASWALRFVACLDGVTTVLSGMSNEEQMDDNLKTFTNFEHLNENERGILVDVVKKMSDMPLVPCTACRYCCDDCPAKINISEILRALNTARLYPNDERPRMFYNNLVSNSGRAKDCVECGQCESVCPQHLPIVELIKESSEEFDAVA